VLSDFICYIVVWLNKILLLYAERRAPVNINAGVKTDFDTS